MPRASFEGAKFIDDVLFNGVQFTDRADFRGAQFSGRALFTGAHFVGGAEFDDARFSRDASFLGTQFLGRTTFQRARFSEFASFGDARFADLGSFQGSQFSGRAVFSAQFEGAASFTATDFFEDADFGETRFSGYVGFIGVHFNRNASFEAASFGQPVTLGPLVVSGRLSLDRTAVDHDFRLDVSAVEISCRGTRFGGRTELNVRWAEVALDDVVFKQRSRLAGANQFDPRAYRMEVEFDESPAHVCRVDRRIDADARPRLVSLRRATVENLALSNVDLRACRFFGAHGLDQLRLDADCEFAQPPPLQRYTPRLTLSEEHHWRAHRHELTNRKADVAGKVLAPTGSHWYRGESQAAGWLEPKGELLDPPRIATLYRALRKAFEDRKDEPGAADFCYGEMEMRRASKPPWPERLLLHGYWLVSGYGLRAARAVLCLALAILAGAFLLDWFGFRPDRSFGRSSLFAVESSISLLRAPQAKLSAGGEVVQIGLRLLGPLFLGLALLALRGRIKR